MQRVEGKRDHLWQMIDSIGIAMLVTHDGHGDNLRARPMGARCDADANAIYFLTRSTANKDVEIDANANVCLAFANAGDQKYASVTGTATMSNDRAKIREIWSAFDKVWFKDADDPDIRLVKVTPAYGEYWDSPGALVTYVKMAVAATTGGKPDLGEHDKVDLKGAATRP